MSFHPTEDQIEWHMGQLRNWMVPNPVPIPQKRASSQEAFPQDFYVQNVPSNDYYDFDAFSMQYPAHPSLHRAQTFSDLNDFDLDYEVASYGHGPVSPGSCLADDMGILDDVASCYSEAPSSYMSSDVTERSAFGSINSSNRQPSVTSQPAPSLLQPPTEVDNLMKTLQPASFQSQPIYISSSNKVKKHLCPHSDCAKSFSQPTHLKIHLRSHTGEKPYTCSVPSCRQSFSQLGNLRTHERRHVGQRPNRKRSASDPGARAKRYECKLDGCRAAGSDGGKVFTQLGNLKAHMNKFHKDTLARLSETFASADDTVEEMQLREYFRDLYKNSNKGIKGRGKGRKVEVIVDADADKATETTAH